MAVAKLLEAARACNCPGSAGWQRNESLAFRCRCAAAEQVRKGVRGQTSQDSRLFNLCVAVSGCVDQLLKQSAVIHCAMRCGAS